MKITKMGDKRTRLDTTPSPKKKAKSSSITPTQKRKLVWKVTKIDDNFKWGWNQITCPYFLRNIWEKMRNFETMTWGDILGRDHHEILVFNITSKAQKRLKELGHDDEEILVSFHITGLQRIWAIRSKEQAYLLWWDPNHEICPSYRKHT